MWEPPTVPGEGVMGCDDPETCRSGFWSSVTWPRGEGVIVVGAALVTVALPLFREPRLSALGLVLAAGFVLAMVPLWALCRVLIAWVRWPSGSRWVRG